MVQFILCSKSTCPKIETCYRYRASPDHQDQLYNPLINMCNETDEYKYHIKIRPDDKIRNLEEINGMKNIIEQSKDDKFNPNTSDDLKFINHVEDEMIKLDEILKNESLENGIPET